MKQKTRHLLPSLATALRVGGGLGAIALGAVAGPSASAAPFLADVSINIGLEAGPPPPPREVIVASPGPGYIWLGGYWDGAPGHYRWVRGHWDRPPRGREHARWVAPRWERDHDGHYRKVEGGWR
jgi:hypothetical protein